MVIATIILATITILLILATSTLLLRLRRPRRLLAAKRHRSVLVHRIGQPSIRGHLIEILDDGVVLRRAQLLLEPEHRGEATPPPISLDGETAVPWFIIECVQVLDPAPLRAPASPPPPRKELAESFARAPADPRPGKAA